jgi:DnaB-like helicase C terminal domain
MLAESTEIERAADIIIVLDRPDQDDRETPRAGEADLCVVKNKFGPEAVITVAWQSHYTRFIDLSVNAYPIFTRKKKTANSEQEDEQNWDTIDSPDSFLSDDPVAEGFPKDADKL